MITSKMIDEVIGAGLNTPSPEEVISVVSSVTGISPQQITGRTRRAELVTARHVGMWICASLKHLPLKEIGNRFGGRDHTTVIHACRAVDGYLSIALSDTGVRSFHERQVLKYLKSSIDLLNARGYDVGDAAELINMRLSRG